MTNTNTQEDSCLGILLVLAFKALVVWSVFYCFLLPYHSETISLFPIHSLEPPFPTHFVHLNSVQLLGPSSNASSSRKPSLFPKQERTVSPELGMPYLLA